MILHRRKIEVGGANKARNQFKGITADRKIILRSGGKLSKESLHCLGFLAQFEDEVPNAEETPDDGYLSLVSSNLEERESIENEELGKSLQAALAFLREFLAMDVNREPKFVL